MERARGGPFGQVRAGEGAAVGWAFTYFFCLIGSFYVLRPIREEMGIRGGVDQLQWSFTATFLVMLVAVPVYSALVARVPRARAVPIVYAFFAACLVAFHVAFRIDPHQPVVARTFFTWLSVFNLFVVTVFWSLMADLFTSEQGRRLFGLVAGGVSFAFQASERASLFLEGFGWNRTEPGGPGEQMIDSGLQYLLGNRLMVDARVGVTFGRESNGSFAGLGASFLF